MRKWMTAALLAGGIALAAPALAQAPVPTYPDATGTPGAYTNPADAGYATYQTTGWDPSLIAYLSGGLGLAGLGLKGMLRRKATD